MTADDARKAAIEAAAKALGHPTLIDETCSECRSVLAVVDAVTAVIASHIRQQALDDAMHAIRMELRNYGTQGSYDDATFDNALLYAIDTIREQRNEEKP